MIIYIDVDLVSTVVDSQRKPVPEGGGIFLLRDRRAMIRYRVKRILSHFLDIDIHICINYCLRVRRSAGIEHIHIISD